MYVSMYVISKHMNPDKAPIDRVSEVERKTTELFKHRGGPNSCTQHICKATAQSEKPGIRVLSQGFGPKP